MRVRMCVCVCLRLCACTRLADCYTFAYADFFDIGIFQQPELVDTLLEDTRTLGFRLEPTTFNRLISSALNAGLEDRAKQSFELMVKSGLRPSIKVNVCVYVCVFCMRVLVCACARVCACFLRLWAIILKKNHHLVDGHFLSVLFISF